MVMGGQLSYFLTTPESYLGHDPGNTKTFTLENLSGYFDINTLTTKTPYLHFMQGARPADKSLFPYFLMTSEEFLESFAADPASKNIIGGAMLYSRERFIRSGGLARSEEHTSELPSLMRISYA